jgi:acetyl esterase/lipase
VTEPEAVEYLPGRLADVYPAPDGSPVLLLWHGSGGDERDVLRPLASAVAAAGVAVVVPDWRLYSPDLGRRELLASLEYALSYAADFGGDQGRVALAGWSAGAAAAAGLTLRPEVYGGWRPVGLAGLAGAYGMWAPTTGSAPLDDAATTDTPPVPVRLAHGTRDEVVGVESSRSFADALRARGWPVTLDEPAVDHAGAVLTEYDPSIRRCRPSERPEVVAARDAVVDAVVRAARAS